MSALLPEVYLARHGETAWTVSRQHTGRTDLPLLMQGTRDALRLAQRLKGRTFAKVLVSPLGRARRTCELAGSGDTAVVDPELHEWEDGNYDGRRTDEIRQERPGWFLFRDGCPGGESVEAIGTRADRVIARLRAIEGDALLFSHGHFLRVLAARWLRLPAGDARLFILSTAALSILGYEHNMEEPAIRLWNDQHHLLTEHVEAL
jgi:broad specificity phosphatase PhoE